MKDELHIRNAKAAHLARILARRTGQTIDEVVLEALRQYRPASRQPARQGRIKYRRRLLRKDRAGRVTPEMPIEAIYDETSDCPRVSVSNGIVSKSTSQ
jgi:hypothetical protein